MLPSAEKLVREYETLKNRRGTFTTHWQQAARYVWPQADEFWENKGNSSKGEYKHNHIYDDTAAINLPRFAAVLESMLIPRGSEWHGLKTGTDLDDIPEVSKWLEDAARVLFKKRYHPKANFQGQMNQAFMSLGIGQAAVHVDYEQGVGFKYRNYFIGDVYIMENECGLVDRVYRRFDLSNDQAVRKFDRPDDKLPKDVSRDAEDKPFEYKEYLHVSVPNPAFIKGSDKPEEKRFFDAYIHLATKQFVRIGGNGESPYAVGRYSTAPHEENGRGPALLVLPSIKRLNEIRRDLMRANNKNMDPPILTSDDGLWGGAMVPNLAPGGYNPGALTAEGRALMAPLQTGINVQSGQFEVEDARASIREAFLLSLYQIMTEMKHNTSATEASIRAQEKADLLAPIVARQQTEMLGSIVEREIELAFEHELFPPLPQALLDAQQAGDVELDITYSSPLDNLQLATKLSGIAQTTQLAREMVNFDPTVAKRLDTTIALEWAAKASGAPAGFVKPAEEVEREVQQEQAVQMQQFNAEAAAQASQANLNEVKADQIQSEMM